MPTKMNLAAIAALGAALIISIDSVNASGQKDGRLSGKLTYRESLKSASQVL